MLNFSELKKKRDRGVLDGQFLIAMPGLADPNFARSVVLICAHSSDGAMGFIINRPQTLTFPDVLKHLKLITEEREESLSQALKQFPVRSGGPMENGRGFVLHSDDFVSRSSIPVTDDVCLTATLDVVEAILRGHGPKKAALLLGYAGWSAGQLEQEMASNTWLNGPASDDVLFDHAFDDKYDRALGLMGVTTAMLSSEAGHA